MCLYIIHTHIPLSHTNDNLFQCIKESKVGIENIKLLLEAYF